MTFMHYILTLPGESPVYPYTLNDLKRANPGVSFPRDMSNFDATPWHCYPVQPTEPPTAPGKIAERADPEQIDGVWYERWTLVDYTPPVPDTVSMRQARLALLGAGLLDSVGPAIAAIADPVQRRAAEISWEYSAEVTRGSALVAALGTDLSLADSDIDNLFRTAATL